jgi:hypothetical protein
MSVTAMTPPKPTVTIQLKSILSLLVEKGFTVAVILLIPCPKSKVSLIDVKIFHRETSYLF